MRLVDSAYSDMAVVADFRRALPYELWKMCLRIDDIHTLEEMLREYAVVDDDSVSHAAAIRTGNRTSASGGSHTGLTLSCWFCDKTGHKNVDCPEKKRYLEMASRESGCMEQHRTRTNGPGSNGGRAAGGGSQPRAGAVSEAESQAGQEPTTQDAQQSAVPIAGAVTTARGANAHANVTPAAAVVTERKVRHALRDGGRVDIIC